MPDTFRGPPSDFERRNPARYRGSLSYGRRVHFQHTVRSGRCGFAAFGGKMSANPATARKLCYPFTSTRICAKNGIFLHSIGNIRLPHCPRPRDHCTASCVRSRLGRKHAICGTSDPPWTRSASHVCRIGRELLIWGVNSVL